MKEYKRKHNRFQGKTNEVSATKERRSACELQARPADPYKRTWCIDKAPPIDSLISKRLSKGNPFSKG